MGNDMLADSKAEPSLSSEVVRDEGISVQATGATSSMVEEPREVVPVPTGDTRMLSELAGIATLAAVALQTDMSATESYVLPAELNAPPPVLALADLVPQQESMLPPKVCSSIPERPAKSKGILKIPSVPSRIGLLADSRPVVPRPTPQRDILGARPVAFPPPRLQSRIIDPPFTTKRPGGSFLLPSPPKKRMKVDLTSEGLPVVPTQAKLKASTTTKPPTPKSDTKSSSVQIDHRRKNRTMGIFPGGRGVPSPTFGAMYRFTKSPLLDVAFCSKMAMNGNPFRTLTHKPVDLYDWTRKRSYGSAQSPEVVLSPRALAAPITISVVKSETGGLFDSAEGDGMASKLAKKPKSKKKKTFPVHERVTLDKANFSSPKDKNLAKKLLAGIHDVSAILPMHEAMWLGKTLWIFTIEQLEYTLSSGDKSRNSLCRAVALSNLIAGNQGSIDEANAALLGTSPIKPDVTPNISESSNGVTYNSQLSSVPVGEKVKDVSIDVSTEVKVAGDELMNGSGTKQLCDAQSRAGDYLREIKAKVEVSTEAGQEIDGTKSETPEEIDETSGDSMLAVETLPTDSLVSDAKKSTSAEEKASSGTAGHVEGTKSAVDIDHAQSVQAHTMKEVALQPILSAMVTDVINDESKRGDPNDVEPASDKMRAASEILDKWLHCILKYKAVGDPESAREFLLSGPVGQLLPELVRLFLETVRITTLMGFFSLKKTEASPLIQYYRDWRTHCALPPMKGYCLARHLLGMCNRIEKGVRSMPPADYQSRTWMKEVLVVLTGSSKDFIIDECRVVDVEYFLNERTKEWSDRLVIWREQNNLPPLKGSGKVAMVSGWKTMLKEALDVERGTGRVLTEAELLQIPTPGPEEEVVVVEPVVPKIEVKEKKKRAVKKQSKPPTPLRYESGHSALQSEEFLASVLRPENIKFLQSIRIANAEQLIACEKQQSSPIIIELMAFRSEATGMQAQAPTCVRLMYDWTQRVKNRLEEIQSDTVKSLAKKRGPRQKEDNEIPRGGPIVIAVPKSPSKPRQRGPTKPLKEPMAALSLNIRSFLKTMGIENSHTFLETKTSVISSTYIMWRANANMTMLKGYGSIATVSGWKAQVRKAASIAGNHDLAATEPANRSKWSTPEDSLVGANHRSSTLDQMTVVPTVHSTLLFGLPERRVYVQGPTGITFAFDLTVRKSARVPDHLSTFLTYLGQLRDSAFWPTPDKLGIIDLDPDRLPLLVDVSDSWEQTDQLLVCSAFSSVNEGCGIVDLGRYNVLLPKQGYMDVLKQSITDFLESKASSVDTVVPPAAENGENSKIAANLLFLHTQLAQPSPVFFHPKPLEKGQMVELCLSDDQPIHVASEPKESASIVLRNRIMNQISRLPLPDIKTVLHWAVCQSFPPFSISIGKHTSSTVLQRRFHWIATALLDHFEEIEDKLVKCGKGHHPDRSVLYKTADSLLMKAQHFQPLRSTEDASSDSSFHALTTEILSELESSLSTNTHGVAPSDPAAYCELAFSLRGKCKEAASAFVVLKTPQSLQCQEVLLEEFCSIAVKAVESFFSENIPLEQLVLQRPDGDGAQEGFLATGSDWHMPVFRPLVDVKSGDAEINSHWYLQYQILGAVHSVAASCQLRWLRTPDPVYTYKTLISKVGNYLAENRYNLQPLTKVLPPNWSLSTRFVDRTLFSRIVPIPQVPSSLPLFLGLVWPKLRATFGWRIDAGLSKDDVAFLPPGGKNRAKRRHDRSAKIKQERQRKRAKLDKRLREVGFGYVPKFTKRLVVQTDQAESGASKVARPVRQVLENFSEHILSQTENPESDVSKQRVDSIVKGLCKCFEALLPILDNSIVTNDDTDPLSLAYGCEQLIPMLVLIPSILHQSGLPIRQIEDSISMIKEFVRYISENDEESFDTEYIPFEEEYDDSEEIANDFLAAKLDSVASRDSKGGDSSDVKSAAKEDETMVRDFVQAGDETDLTAFTATTMRQMVPCRATLSDTKTKGRRHIPVGYPGMVCRHCWGTGEGKYFFTSSDSLGTAGGVVYAHLLKCQKFPADRLKKLSGFKSQQTEARKRLKHGAQAAYFNRLWKRLHSAKTIGTGGVFVVSADRDEGTVNEDGQMPPYGVALTPDGTKKKPIEFHTHADLLEYIQKTAPWNKEAVLEEAVDLYYDALRQGSRIFNTTAMPSHFSSEWLLARVSLVSLHNASRRQQPSMGA